MIALHKSPILRLFFKEFYKLWFDEGSVFWHVRKIVELQTTGILKIFSSFQHVFIRIFVVPMHLNVYALLFIIGQFLENVVDTLRRTSIEILHSEFCNEFIFCRVMSLDGVDDWLIKIERRSRGGSSGYFQKTILRDVFHIGCNSS